MNYYRNDRINWRDVMTLILLIVVTTVIIVAVLPRKSATQYVYEIGQPWKYGPVIAKYNFYIIRHKDSIQHEKDVALANYKPYYSLDNKVETKAVEDFNRAFNDSTAGDLLVFKEHIIQRLRFIYPKGIMNPEDYIKYSSDSTKEIHLEEGNNKKDVGIKRILTPKSAYDLLFFDEELKENKARLNRLNISDYIKPNLTYDTAKNQNDLEELDRQIVKVKGEVVEGEKIVETGDLVTEEIYRKPISYEKKEEDRNANKTEFRNKIIGQSITVLMFVILFTCYLLIFRKNYFDNLRNILMLYAMIIIFPILVNATMNIAIQYIYVLPFAMAPILIRVFLDSRTAFITHTTIILISSIAVNYQYEFILIEIVGGLTAIFALNDMSKRAHLFKAAFLVTICTAVMYYATQLIQTDELIPKGSSIIYRSLIFNGILLLLAYPLMWTIEKVFGFVSVVTLFELSDSSRGLLRKLSEIAPGTFQHSTTVGNLAYDIANKIGANGLLVRTGALYHDIGKMSNPVFFTENQASVNPHNKLSEKESAQIITNHVTEGQKLAEKYNLPDVIKNFILTHHGHGTAKYFYIKYKNEHPNEEVDIDAFSYHGPNPFTREQAILMMADSVEAASRSLTEYNDENIRNLVNKIIDSQVNEGYFTVCPITFLDIATAKQVLIERLKNIYHTRIQYPELKKEAATPSTEGGSDRQSKSRSKRNRMKFKR